MRRVVGYRAARSAPFRWDVALLCDLAPALVVRSGGPVWDAVFGSRVAGVRGDEVGEVRENDHLVIAAGLTATPDEHAFAPDGL
jgi:hypothetical protein